MEAVLEDADTVLSPASDSSLRLILSSAGRMDRLINDLLAYGRISRAEIKLINTPLEPVVAGVLTDHGATIEKTRAVVRVVKPLPSVRADSVGLQQVLSNLIGNALKFTSPGKHPELCIRAETHADRVRLWVEDRGIGIDPRQHEAIFELFHRLHGARDYSGTGIGLSLVRKGMMRMGGACGVESEPGQGSRFWLDFPSAPERAAV